MHDARLGARLAHEAVGLAEPIGRPGEVAALVREHAQRVDRVVRLALAAALGLREQRLGLLDVAATLLRQEVERAAHLERRQREVALEHRAVAVLGGQARERVLVRLLRLGPAAGELVGAAHLALHLRGGAALEARVDRELQRAGERGAGAGLVAVAREIIGMTRGVADEPVGVAAAALVARGLQVPQHEVVHARVLAAEQQRTRDGAQGHAALGAPRERELHRGVTGQLAHARARTAARRGVEAPEETPERARAVGRRREGLRRRGRCPLVGVRARLALVHVAGVPATLSATVSATVPRAVGAARHRLRRDRLRRRRGDRAGRLRAVGRGGRALLLRLLRTLAVAAPRAAARVAGQRAQVGQLLHQAEREVALLARRRERHEIVGERDRAAAVAAPVVERAPKRLVHRPVDLGLPGHLRGPRPRGPVGPRRDAPGMRRPGPPRQARKGAKCTGPGRIRGPRRDRWARADAAPRPGTAPDPKPNNYQTIALLRYRTTR
ncbi:MAG: hypothetical protein U1E39_00430 [Planctomycetota bacterium]